MLALDEALAILRGDRPPSSDAPRGRWPPVGAAAGLPGDAVLVEALGVVGRRADASAVPLVRTVLSVTRTFPSDVHVAAVRALGRLGSAAAVEPLLLAAGDPAEEEDTREAAREALIRVGPVALDPLGRVLERELDPDVVTEAARAYLALRDRGEPATP